MGLVLSYFHVALALVFPDVYSPHYMIMPGGVYLAFVFKTISLESFPKKFRLMGLPKLVK